MPHLPNPGRLASALRWGRRHPRLLAGVGLIGAIAAAQRLAPPSSAPVRPTPLKPDYVTPQAASPALARRFVGPKLRDPASARYRDVTYRRRQGLPVLCGEVSSRNGFNGYTGFQQFIAVGPLVDFQEASAATRWRQEWRRFCVLTDADDAKAAAKAGGARHGRS